MVKRVILSCSLQKDYSNYILVREFSQIRSVVDKISDIEILIIHEYKESDFDIGIFINEFHKQGIGTIIYMNTNQSITVNTLISGVSGYSLSDDFYLDDEDELNSIIEDLLSGEAETDSLTDSAVVVNFIQSFARGDEQINAPLYLDQVKQAVNNLSKIVTQKDYQITNMGENTLEIFENASTIIKQLTEYNRKTSKEIDTLKQEINKNLRTNNKPLSNRIDVFGQYNFISGSTNVLLVKEYTPCRYLTSFLLMYSEYLHKRRGKRVKL